jgi:SAM-dependent methyltransferase
MKQYDREYYDRWYRDAGTRIATADTLERKVRLAVAAAELILGRRVRSVLDVGCGEGAWYPVLRRLRRGVSYTGVESSEHVLSKFGRRRNIRRGSFGGLRQLGMRRPFDLVVCADVIQYVSDTDLRHGLAEIRRLTGGVAYVESFAAEDAMEGDRNGWIDRPEKTLRRFFGDAGLTHCGFYCWIDERKVTNANRFEVAISS